MSMYEIKNKIYLDFDKTQKSGICNFLRSLVKQNLELTTDEILTKFLEDEIYYQKLNASRFPYLVNYLDNKVFIGDTKAYLNECKKYYEYKERQRPLVEANKAFEKKKRRFLQEVKMSREKPTKKQLYYYNKLCEKYSIEKKDTNELSKLDIRNEIERIINEHAIDYKKDD